MNYITMISTPEADTTIYTRNPYIAFGAASKRVGCEDTRATVIDADTGEVLLAIGHCGVTYLSTEAEEMMVDEISSRMVASAIAEVASMSVSDLVGAF